VNDKRKSKKSLAGRSPEESNEGKLENAKGGASQFFLWGADRGGGLQVKKVPPSNGTNRTLKKDQKR